MDAVLFPEVALLVLFGVFLFGVDAERCEYDIIGGWRNGEKEWKVCPGGCCISDCCPRSEAEDVTYAVIGAAVVVAIVVGVVVAVVCCRRRSRTRGQILNAARQRVTIIGITTTVPYTTMENAEEPPTMAPPCYEDVAGLPPYTEVAGGPEQQQQQQQPPTMGAK